MPDEKPSGHVEPLPGRARLARLTLLHVETGGLRAMVDGKPLAGVFDIVVANTRDGYGDRVVAEVTIKLRGRLVDIGSAALGGTRPAATGDEIAAAAAREIVDLPTPLGGATQRLAQVQCVVAAAIGADRRESGRAVLG